ncbi:hypothetical protein PI124_g1247 [Phytophthora idaei]|nr:hypothetical protein PI125_g9551 [Phytophthora idaei]KAG3173587.1 hypothetical protein PI126_g763 [Phytophthora idaei]KAG3254127.1 hypothetical protein PI124_g1247 [Phytophthora idaei]
MRFYYAVLATAATLLASTNAVTVDTQHNQISQTAQIHSDVKRSLRSHQYEYEEKDSVDSLDDTEERGRGVTHGKLMKLVKAHDVPLDFDLTVLGVRAQKNIQKVLKNQGLSQQQLRKKLGSKNSNFFQEWKENFHTGNLPKKHHEDVF